MYNTRSQMALDVPLRETNTGQQALSFLVIWTKISHSARIVTTTACFTHTLKREILNKTMLVNNLV